MPGGLRREKLEEKSAIVIGAGIAGLSAGCYAQMNGYKTHIFEMHDKPGGLCTAWDRKGYTIDGCLHWLVGSAPGNNFYPYWQELGMLQGQKVIDMDRFYTYESTDGKSFTVFCNIDRLVHHMKELSPEDSDYISGMASAMRHMSRMEMPMDKAPELSTAWDGAKAMAGMLPHMNVLRKWASMTMADFTAGFKSPLLREGLEFMPAEFSAMGFMMTVAWMHNKVAGYVIGGSMPAMRAVEKRYNGLGGKITYKAKVEKIMVEANRAVGVKLSNGEEYRADYVISAGDGHAAIFDMLEGKYIDDTIRGYYDNMPIFTPLVYVGLGINRRFDDVPQLISGIVVQLQQPTVIAGRTHKQLHVRINNFDPTMAPEGKTVVTSMIESNYAYWKELRKDQAKYKAEKEQVARFVIAELEKRFPGVKDKVEMIDVSTPVSFERYTGNWQGCYEGFMPTPKTLRLQMKKTLPGLDNFYMVGQWVSPGGGLPSGVMTGRHVTQILCKRDGRKFVTSVPGEASMKIRTPVAAASR